VKRAAFGSRGGRLETRAASRPRAIAGPAQDRWQASPPASTAGTAGGPTITRLWPPAARDFERPLGAFLAFDIGKVERQALDLANFGCGASAPACL